MRYRLLLIVIFLLIATSVRPSHAEGTVSPTSTFSYSSISPCVGPGQISELAACQSNAYAPYYLSCTSAAVIVPTSTGTPGILRASCDSGYSIVTHDWPLYLNSGTTSCPLNSSLVASQCTCNTNYLPDSVTPSTACVSAALCVSGATSSAGWYDTPLAGTGAPALTSCNNNCSATYQGNSISKTTLINGVQHYFSKGEYVNNGAICPSYGNTSAPSNASTYASVPPAPTCGAGEIYVSYGAMGYVCASQSILAGTASAVGAYSTIVGSVVDASAPSVATTMSTTTNASGVQTTTTGSLLTPPINVSVNLPPDLAKTGDIQAQTAAINAELEGIKQTTDQQKVTGGSEAAIAAAAVAGADTGNTASPAATANRTTRDLSTSITEGAPVFSRAGLSDVTFSTGTNYSVTLPFSKLNPMLIVIGQIGVALTLVVAAYLVF